MATSTHEEPPHSYTYAEPEFSPLSSSKGTPTSARSPLSATAKPKASPTTPSTAVNIAVSTHVVPSHSYTCAEPFPLVPLAPTRRRFPERATDIPKKLERPPSAAVNFAISYHDCAPAGPAIKTSNVSHAVTRTIILFRLVKPAPGTNTYPPQRHPHAAFRLLPATDRLNPGTRRTGARKSRGTFRELLAKAGRNSFCGSIPAPGDTPVGALAHAGGVFSASSWNPPDCHGPLCLQAYQIRAHRTASLCPSRAATGVDATDL